MDPDGNLTAYLFLIIVFLLINALLTAGSTALTALSDSKVKKMSSSQEKIERFIFKLLKRPSDFFDGIKLAKLICTVIIATAGCLTILRLALRTRLMDGAGPAASSLILILLSTVAVVLACGIFCDRLPYRIACRYPEGVSRSLARLCWFFSCLCKPFVLLNTAVSKGLAALLGVHEQEEPEPVTEEEIRLMVDVGNEKGQIEQSEKDMINNIFEFDDRTVSEIMTHRTELIAVPKTAPLHDITALAIDSGYSRIPVYGDDIDDIIGLLYVKDLLCLIGKNEEGFCAQNYMRRALFVPEGMKCVDLFAQFKLQKVQIAVAVDEYGGTAGIVSMEDLLESIVGNIQDEYDSEEEEVFELAQGVYAIDGTLSIDETERLLDIELPEDSDYDTIGGLLTEILERIPAPDEHPCVEVGGAKFTVLLVEDRRIARVRAELLPKEPEDEDAAE